MIRAISAPARGERVLLAVLLPALAVLSLWPMARLLAEAASPGPDLDFPALRGTLAAAATWQATLNTVEIAVGATVVALLLGGLFAVLIAVTDIRAKTALVFAFMLPLMIPPQITAIAWIQVFGPSSALLKGLGLAPPPGTPNPLYSKAGIVLLMGIEHAAIVFLALRAGLRAIPRDLVEAAQASGARPLRVLATIVLPLARPALLAGAALAFVSAVGNFGIPALLGIPAGVSVLPTLIYRRLAGFGTSALAEAAVLSVLVGLIALAGTLAHGRAAAHADARVLGMGGKPVELRLGRWRRWTEALAWTAVGLIVVLPLAALVSTALVRVYGLPLSADAVTLAHFAQVFDLAATRRAFANSLMLAGGAATVLSAAGLLLGYLVVHRPSPLVRVATAAAELPYAIPGVVLAIACILVFLKPLPLLGSLYGTMWIILAAYLARFLALALRPAVAGYQALDRAMEEAAQTCGAGFAMRLRTVVVPLVAPSAAAGGILVFLIALNELTVSVLLWSSGRETLGVLVYSLEEGGNTPLAAAVSVLAVLVVLGVMVLATLLGRRLPPGVLPWRA